jgi:hypothetical protein
MITTRSATPTDKRCSLCNESVIRPWGARPDEYLVCDVCAARHPRMAQPVQEESPDLADSFWRIATGDKQ